MVNLHFTNITCFSGANGLHYDIYFEKIFKKTRQNLLAVDFKELLYLIKDNRVLNANLYIKDISP